MAEKKLYVIDASGFLFRSYFAIPHMTNAEGFSTNALYGFIRSLLKIFKDFSPTHCVAVFDGPNNQAKRKEIYPEYKSHRVAVQPDLYDQIEEARNFCSLYGIPFLSIEGVEADDTMGSIAKWGEKHGFSTYLCTSDKDLAQMVSDKTYLLNAHKENRILDKKGVEETYGVPPEKIIDLMAMVGDSSDNIPGLPGFGPKTAASLLQQFPSLDYILDHPKEIPGKKKQEVVEIERDLALLSRTLVTIDTDVPIPYEPDFYTLQKGDPKALQEFYSSMHFLSLLKEMSPKENSSIHETQYHLINDEKALDALIKKLQTQKIIAFDTETTHYQPMKAELVGIGLGFAPGEAWYIPLNGNIPRERVLSSVKTLFENEKIAFFAHNAKYDIHILANEEITVKNLGFDTILASYILNAHSRRHSLDTLSLELFGKQKISLEELIGKGRDAKKMPDVPLEPIKEYCCEDVDYTIRLKIELEKQLQERNLLHLLTDIELPLLPVLAKMERHGIFVDESTLEKQGTAIREQIATQKKKIFSLCGEEFNLNSPKQISEILFQKLGIKPPKKTATGHSTSASVLESLEKEYPIAREILEYRQLEKLRSTYIETLPQEVLAKDHRIHCTFVQSGTTTGRLSCQDPNLQNIPIRSEAGRQIREAFRPEKKGWSFLSADYSQMELRLLAHLCEDPKLIDAFQKGVDVHAATAAELWEVPVNQVSYEQRQQAKAVNFGVIYGQQAFGLSQGIGIPHKEAAAFIEKYFSRYQNVKNFLESCKERARETGKTTTYTGRERVLPEILSKNAQIRFAAERLAVNTPIQGSAADMIKKAMIHVQSRLDQEKKKGYMILQIHDELLFEVPDDEIDAFQKIVREEMEGVVQLRVPLLVDIHVGKNWKEC